MTEELIRLKLINKLYPDRRVEKFDKDDPDLYYYNGDSIGSMSLSYDTIFAHDFAKAFWGEERCSCDCEYDAFCLKCITDYEWQYHLQQMVLEEEPLKYIEKFL